MSGGLSVSPRMLVIDDEVFLGQTLRMGLEDAFSIEVELRGQPALDRLLSGEQWDIVLCDLSLPDLSGSQIWSRLREARPELASRFVIMTGGAVTQESQSFLSLYPGPVLQKPFRLSDVEALAVRILGL
jgi:CheY-like chemotaxis protein